MNVKVLQPRYALGVSNGINSTLYKERGPQAQEKGDVKQLLQNVNDLGVSEGFSIQSTENDDRHTEMQRLEWSFRSQQVV